MLDLSSLFGCFVLGIIGWITYKLYIFPYYISPLRKIPGPPSENLLYGNFKRLFNEEPGEPYLRWMSKYGNFTKFYGIFNRPTVLTSDVKIIQEILINQAYDFIKPGDLTELMALLGKGLILIEGEDHKRQRKMMNPAFSHNNIKEMVPDFIRVASALKDIIKSKVDKGETKINLTSYISKATLDIIGLVGFDYKFNSLTSQSELAEAYDSTINSPITFTRIIIGILTKYIPFVRKIPIAINREFNSSIKIIERESKKIMKEKYEKADNNELDGNDLLSLLININKTLPAEEKMADDELKYQIMTFLAAGHDTTSAATSWALHFLAQHPHEQDLLREELVKSFPNKSKFNPTFDEINSLEYLNCIVKETLRLTPTVAYVARYTIKDKILGGYFIPKGTSIIISIAALHRSPLIWGTTANKFDPKRWLDPSKNTTNNYSPFTAGPRSCIGSKLATTEFKILLSILIRNFVFQPVEGLHIKRKFGLVTKPDPYLELIVSKVES